MKIEELRTIENFLVDYAEPYELINKAKIYIYLKDVTYESNATEKETCDLIQLTLDIYYQGQRSEEIALEKITDAICKYYNVAKKLPTTSGEVFKVIY